MPQNRRPRPDPPPQRPNPEETQEIDFDLLPEEIDALVEGAGTAPGPRIEPLPDNLQSCNKELLATRHQLDEMAANYGKVMQALSATQHELTETAAKTADLVEENATLKKPPLGYAMVIELNKDDDTVDVDNGNGNPLRVVIHPRVERTDLARGATVLMASNGAILSVVEPRHIGRQAAIVSLLDEGTALVQAEGDRKDVVRITGSIERSRLETGTPVLVSGGFITRIITEMGRSNPLGAASVYALAEMPDKTFADIGGLDDEVAEILAALEDPLTVPHIYDILGLKKTFSTLLFGLPGNGKTTIAKAIARHSFDKYREQILATGAKGNFIAIKGPELHNKWWGNTEERLRQIFAGAQRLHEASGAPVFIFFDDCESLFVSRGATENFTPNMDVVNQFNTLVEGVTSLKGVNIIAATNRIDLMDPAVVDRFGKQKRINPPETPKKATQVLQRLIGEVPFDGITRDEAIAPFVERIFRKGRDTEILKIHFEDEDDTKIVRLPELLSGRMLRDIVDSAKTHAKDRIKVLPAEKQVVALRLTDLDAALETVLLNKESLPTTKQQVLDWLRQGGDKRVVDDVINLREYRKTEAKRDLRADRQVE